MPRLASPRLASFWGVTVLLASSAGCQATNDGPGMPRTASDEALRLPRVDREDGLRAAETGDGIAAESARPMGVGPEDSPYVWIVEFHEVPDFTVLADVDGLTVDTDDYDVAAAGSTFPEPHQFLVQYLGKGSPSDEPVEEPTEPVVEDEGGDLVNAANPTHEVWVGANMGTRNRFRIWLPRTALGNPEEPTADERALASASEARDGTTGGHEGGNDLLRVGAVGARDLADLAGDGPMREQPVDDAIDLAGRAEPRPESSWSNNYDSRQQIYSTNAAVGGVNVWQLEYGDCSAVLVGARHYVTAGHCITARGDGGEEWLLDGITVNRGRNGSSIQDAIEIDTDNIPPGEVAWWWTHADWTDDPGDLAEDFGVVTLPESFGCVSFNGQCAFHYGYLHGSTLDDQSIYQRGYPGCDPMLSNGANRIDEPCQNASQTPSVCANYGTWSCTTPCRDNHLYGQPGACGWGSFTDADSNSEKRRFWHGCDASAADSGSSIYFSYGGYWRLAGLQTFSNCGKSCSESCAGQTTPNQAQRMTTNRASAIYWFISNWPNY